MEPPLVLFGLISFGITELLVIAVLVIVFVGPDRLPEMMRFVGRQYGRLRKASDELRRAFQIEVDRVDSEERAEQIRVRREALMARRRAEREANSALPVAREDDFTEDETVSAVAEIPAQETDETEAGTEELEVAEDPVFPVDDEPEIPETNR